MEKEERDQRRWKEDLILITLVNMKQGLKKHFFMPNSTQLQGILRLPRFKVVCLINLTGSLKKAPVTLPYCPKVATLYPSVKEFPGVVTFSRRFRTKGLPNRHLG